MLSWKAHDVSRAFGRVREPISGESFAGIEERAQSLLREAIQNSLDARLNTSRQIRIRIFLAGGTAALPPAQAANWFRGAWPHISADPKLRTFDSSRPCRFLTVEDFHTKGLQGDLRERFPAPDTENAWCLFFRKEGQSAKSEADRGRWGIGKVVFPLCSDAHAFIAATVRSDDHRRLVMGQAMLRSRTVDGTTYLPDLWLCSPDDSKSIEMPSALDNDFEQLRAAFRLERKMEPGLSVVIPYVDRSITREALLLAAIKEFFCPILDGSLIVDLESDAGPPIHLDQATLALHAETLQGDSQEQIVKLVQMARWYFEHDDPPVLALPPVGKYGFDWSPDQLTKDQLVNVRSSLAAGAPVHIQLPMPVIPQVGPSVNGSFDVVLSATEDTRARKPVFVRSDLIIPEVKARYIRGFHALVIAREPHVSRMLGDAENPAHTDWSKNSSNFQYKYPDKHLNYVKHSAANICQLLSEAQRELVEDALTQFFFAEQPESARSREPKEKGGSQSGKTSPKPPAPNPQPYVVTQAQGGCSIRSTAMQFPGDRALSIAFAYRIRRGDPVKKYNPLDFDLSKLEVTFAGLRITERLLNRIVVEPTHSDFSLDVSGFDKQRDLFVRAHLTKAAL